MNNYGRCRGGGGGVVVWELRLNGRFGELCSIVGVEGFRGWCTSALLWGLRNIGV